MTKKIPNKEKQMTDIRSLPKKKTKKYVQI